MMMNLIAFVVFVWSLSWLHNFVAMTPHRFMRPERHRNNQPSPLLFWVFPPVLASMLISVACHEYGWRAVWQYPDKLFNHAFALSDMLGYIPSGQARAFWAAVLLMLV